MLKADFHTHTSDDPLDNICHSSEMLIDEAAANDIDVLAITCHGVVAHTPYLAEYALAQGVLLIPGIETEIEKRHVVILNPDPEHCAAQTFDELRQVGKRNSLVIAPHPFYPVGASLGEELANNLDVFDAIEYSAMYLPGINFFNQRAARFAKSQGLPLIGNSDTHVLPYAPSTFTLIDAEGQQDAVLDAIREGRVDVETHPRPFPHAINMARFMARQHYLDWGRTDYPDRASLT